MPRLFTALELPEALARELAMLGGGLTGARWIEAEDFHITLRFIGDVGQTVAEEVHSALERVQRAPFTITVGGTDVFGGARPRAIIAGVKPSAALMDLQAEHERLMRRIGLPAETRKYVPHVTLARLRQVTPTAVASFLSLRGFLASRSFEVERFTLFSSRDSVGGGPYLAEATYPFTKPERPA